MKIRLTWLFYFLSAWSSQLRKLKLAKKHVIRFTHPFSYIVEWVDIKLVHLSRKKLKKTRRAKDKKKAVAEEEKKIYKMGRDLCNYFAPLDGFPDWFFSSVGVLYLHVLHMRMYALWANTKKKNLLFRQSTQTTQIHAARCFCTYHYTISIIILCIALSVYLSEFISFFISDCILWYCYLIPLSDHCTTTQSIFDTE